MVMAPEPIEVELLADSGSGHPALKVAWDDGHQSLYPLRYLRGFCPCASCQGHGRGTWTFIPVDAPQITGIEEVGNYALNIVWNDGAKGPHTTGIYAFEILRQLCPCHDCQTLQGPQHALASMPDDDLAS